MTQIFKLSLFRNKRDTKPREVERSWKQLRSNFKTPLVRLEKDGALFCPAIFEPSYRLKENVREVSLLVLDIDHNANLRTLKTQIAEFKSAYVIYSTHSHLRTTDQNPDAEPRFRVCIPLASPIPAGKFPALWQYAKHKTGLLLDESAKDCSRMFYTPVIADKSAPYFVECTDGEFLDWEKLPLDSFQAEVLLNGNGNSPRSEVKEKYVFEFHEDRHSELCRLIETQGQNTGRGTFEMKCPAHNGKGDTSLFYEPKAGTVACLKKPDGCRYFDILKAFGLPDGKLPSREQKEKLNEEFEKSEIKLKPFPVPSGKCFYGLAGEFVKLVEPYTEASSMALLSQFLVYFGNIIGRSAYYQVEGDKHYTNLFCILIGNTAQGRKGTSFGRIAQFFEGIDEHHETECLVSGLASGEGLLYQIRDPSIAQKKNKETGVMEEVQIDSGISDKRLLVKEGEFAQVLRVQGREGNTLSSFIRNLWDKGTARSMTKNSPLKTTDAHVSIIGHITKTELLATMNEVDSANGYANRFLFFAVEREKLLPFGATLPEVEIGRLRDKIIEAINFARQKRLMNFSVEASKLWVSVYERLETSRFGYLAKITQRASPYVLRISLIFAVLDKSNIIEKDHLEAALAVWKYSEDSARYIFGEQLENLQSQKILTALKEKAETGMTRTEIRDLFDRHISNEKLNTALSLLLEYGLAKPKKQETGGRSKEIWFPCVISDKSVLSQEKLSGNDLYNAYNAYNAIDENKVSNCSNCGLKLDFTADKTILFCPFGCQSQPI